jgi:hypothetical protein
MTELVSQHASAIVKGATESLLDHLPDLDTDRLKIGENASVSSSIKTIFEVRRTFYPYLSVERHPTGEGFSHEHRKRSDTAQPSLLFKIIFGVACKSIATWSITLVLAPTQRFSKPSRRRCVRFGLRLLVS